MDFETAIKICAVRESIFREGDKYELSPGGKTDKGVILPPKGTLLLKKYPKNHSISFYKRVPQEDQRRADWNIYDPRDDEFTSLN